MEKRLVAVRPEEDAVVSVVCPVTPRVPPTTALPDAVMLVADALVSVVCPLAVSAETVVVARYELPETVRAVVEAEPADNVLTDAEVEYKFVVVEFVVEAFVATRLVVVAFVAVRLVKIAVTALRRVEKRFVAVSPEEDAVVSVVCPATLRVPAEERLEEEALPRVV